MEMKEGHRILWQKEKILYYKKEELDGVSLKMRMSTPTAIY
jgi:hypothetical protein